MNQQPRMAAPDGGTDDFRRLFEESLRAVKPGEVVRGRVVSVSRDQVTVDIGYKSEGQISINEFTTREGKVKGGLKVDVGVAAFLPGSHADIRPARNLDRFISQRGQFAVLKFNRARGNVVVSRRAVMEREQLKQETLKVLEEGVILEGIVKNITDYGAFVDLGGIDGLLHVTDMSWGRVNKPADV